MQGIDEASPISRTFGIKHGSSNWDRELKRAGAEQGG